VDRFASSQRDPANLGTTLILLCTFDTWIVRSQKIETGVHRIAHTEKPSPHGIKVKNPRYSQLEGREESFDQLLIRVAA